MAVRYSTRLYAEYSFVDVISGCRTHVVRAGTVTSTVPESTRASAPLSMSRNAVWFMSLDSGTGSTSAIVSSVGLATTIVVYPGQTARLTALDFYEITSD